MLGTLSASYTTADLQDLRNRVWDHLQIVQRERNGRCTFKRADENYTHFLAWDIAGTVDDSMLSEIAGEFPNSEIDLSQGKNTLLVPKSICKQYRPQASATTPVTHTYSLLKETFFNILILLVLLSLLWGLRPHTPAS